MMIRTSRRFAMTVGAGVLAGVAAWTGVRPPTNIGAREAGEGRVVADHHLHIRSAVGTAIMEELMRAMGESSGGAPQRPVGAAEVLAAMDAAGVEHGLVLSIAYMFGIPDMDVEDEEAKVRAENDFVAAEVAKYPERLVGACSVNPLASYAFDEVERCADDPRLSVLKLHLTNSDVDLRDPEHLSRLANLFQELARLEMPALVHMRSRVPDYGADDARRFIDEVLSQAPDLPIHIAHMAGWGGYDEATDAALGAFAEAFADGRLDPAYYSFGLGAVVFQPAAAGADTALERRTAESNERLARRIREIGVERVVYATDWPSWPPVADVTTGIERNIRLIEASLPLTEDELDVVFGNVGPVFGTHR